MGKDFKRELSHLMKDVTTIKNICPEMSDIKTMCTDMKNGLRFLTEEIAT